MKVPQRIIASTLQDLVRLRKKSINDIILNNCDDFICKNMMCEKVLQTCLCRIDVALTALENPLSIETIELANNELDRLPPSISRFVNMKKLIVANNQLKDLPLTMLSSFSNIEYIDCSLNPIPKEIVDSVSRELCSRKPLTVISEPSSEKTS